MKIHTLWTSFPGTGGDQLIPQLVLAWDEATVGESFEEWGEAIEMAKAEFNDADTRFDSDDLQRAFNHLCNLQAACEENPDARVVVE